jgi:Cytochrome b5-like Heme/Steroid binding domain
MCHVFPFSHTNSQHNKISDCWLILGNDRNGGAKVYDVTKWLNQHPGGSEILLEFAGLYLFQIISIKRFAVSKL